MKAFLYKHRVWFMVGILCLIYVFLDKLLHWLVW